MSTSSYLISQRARDADVSDVCDLLRAVCNECGLSGNLFIYVHLDKSGEKVVSAQVDHHADLTFDVLDRLSKELGTRDINLSCDFGCESDRSYDPRIEVQGITRDLVGEVRRRRPSGAGRGA